ncbi:MAG TPA: sigma-70 family RNA polymerase sigma factor [Vicinamibacterales bacterium]|jgi:RNA polymerase sigma factor (TIGR02999 family)|nr:sigma-70 family RNA polymerase sigma factor [Vicinamibacterales bacterium]
MEPPAPQADITDLLRRWQGGDAEALNEVTPLVYRELHQIAVRFLSRERPDHTLQSTALVHEAFLKLVDQRRVDWQSRTHFFGLAAQLMRRILVDHARGAGRVKRGAGVATISLDDGTDAAAPHSSSPEDILTLDAALDELEQLDARQCRIVELRYFSGLTLDETADAMQLSPGTIKREWTIARAWLFRRIAGESP